MNLQARTKKAIALIAVALLVVAAGIAAVVWKLVDSAEPRLPEITAYAHGTSVTVAPEQYCNVYLEDCVTGEMSMLDVPAGYPLQLSLPSEIADAPWRLLAVYDDLRTGQRFIEGVMVAPGERRAMTVPADPSVQLLGIEIQLPSALVDEYGEPIAHAVWSLRTA